MGTISSSTLDRRPRTIVLLLPILGWLLAIGTAHAQAPAPPAAATAPSPPAPETPVAPAPPRESKPEALPRAVAPNAASDPVKPAAATPEAAATPSPAAAPKSAANVAKAATTPGAEPLVGTGYHPFDKNYVLAGLNAQIPNDGFILELEASGVPFISNSLFWLGGFASIGTHLALSREEGDPGDDAIRFGGGLEAGWRFLAVDGGYVFDGFRGNAEHRMRLRAGLAIADETFTNADAKYSRCCCHQPSSATSCECDRTPAGLSLFLYWAVEHAPVPGRDSSDHMVGLSVKAGLGL